MPAVLLEDEVEKHQHGLGGGDAHWPVVHAVAGALLGDPDAPTQ